MPLKPKPMIVSAVKKPKRVKFTDAQVAEIRKLHTEGLTYFQIADAFDVTFAAIGYIVRGDVYRTTASEKWAATVARFWSRVEKLSGRDACWLWRGCTHKTTGYGQVTVSALPHITTAHRLSFFITHHRVPKHDTRHRCHTRNCVRPSHLQEGTRRQNMQDAVRAGRVPRGASHWTARRRAS